MTDAMTDRTYGNTLTAFFDEQMHAEHAITRLRTLGLAESAITLTAGSTRGEAERPKETTGFFESLGAFFFPDDDRATYAEGLSRGGYLLTVTQVTPDTHDHILDILEDAGAVDVDDRADTWRQDGLTAETMTSGNDASMTAIDADLAASRKTTNMEGRGLGSEGMGVERERAGLTPPGAAGDHATDDETLPVVEERLNVGTRDVAGGRVRVRSYVVEEPASADVELRSQRVVVERRPVDRAVTAGENAFRDQSIEAEEFHEEAVVGKEARVVEEIGLRREAESRNETVSDTVRRTQVEVDEDETEDTLTGHPGTRR